MYRHKKLVPAFHARLSVYIQSIKDIFTILEYATPRLEGAAREKEDMQCGSSERH